MPNGYEQERSQERINEKRAYEERIKKLEAENEDLQSANAKYADIVVEQSTEIKRLNKYLEEIGCDTNFRKE